MHALWKDTFSQAVRLGINSIKRRSATPRHLPHLGIAARRRRNPQIQYSTDHRFNPSEWVKKTIQFLRIEILRIRLALSKQKSTNRLDTLCGPQEIATAPMVRLT